MPELEPIEVMGTILDVIIIALVLEEELLITPERCCDFRTGHDPAYQMLLATKLGRHVVCPHLEQDRVGRDFHQLVVKVILIVICPAVDIVRLDINLERPMGLGPVAELVEL